VKNGAVMPKYFTIGIFTGMVESTLVSSNVAYFGLIELNKQKWDTRQGTCVT